MSKRGKRSDRTQRLAQKESGDQLTVTRRGFLAGIAGTAVTAGLERRRALGQVAGDAELNLARVAIPTSLTTSSENKITVLNDGFAPASSRDRQHGAYAIRRGFEPDSPAEWVQ